jgi:hypothetical protein
MTVMMSEEQSTNENADAERRATSKNKQQLLHKNKKNIRYNTKTNTR